MNVCSDIKKSWQYVPVKCSLGDGSTLDVVQFVFRRCSKEILIAHILSDVKGRDSKFLLSPQIAWSQHYSVQKLKAKFIRFGTLFCFFSRLFLSLLLLHSQRHSFFWIPSIPKSWNDFDFQFGSQKATISLLRRTVRIVDWIGHNLEKCRFLISKCKLMIVNLIFW
mgnify:CR=1 FL=1